MVAIPPISGGPCSTRPPGRTSSEAWCTVSNTPRTSPEFSSFSSNSSGSAAEVCEVLLKPTVPSADARSLPEPGFTLGRRGDNAGPVIHAENGAVAIPTVSSACADTVSANSRFHASRAVAAAMPSAAVAECAFAAKICLKASFRAAMLHRASAIFRLVGFHRCEVP